MATQWHAIQGLTARKFICGYCSQNVASERGWFGDTRGTTSQAWVYVCPNCSGPSFFGGKTQVPGVAAGGSVDKLPPDVDALYSEARKAAAAGAPTASVLCCRKLLMNIAVAQGAKAGGTFVFYVEFLAKSGYLPPNGQHWVDHIRKKGNEATHEISVMSAEDANELLLFSEMLLKFIYEFPARVPIASTAP